MVERYSYGNKALMGDTEMYEEKDGEFVLYSDYAALETENAKLKKALRGCVEVLEKFTCPECKPKNPLCVVTGEPPCEIVSIPKKAREVLGDA